MTSSIVNTTTQRDIASFPLVAGTFATVMVGTVAMLYPTLLTAHLGVSHVYGIVAGMVLLAGALLGAFNLSIYYVLGGYAYPVGLTVVALVGLHQFQDGTMFALSYTLLGAVLGLVAGLIRLDMRKP